MADISVTATAVLPGSNAVTENGICGATITAGQAVYKSSTTGYWGLADNDGASEEIRFAKGIALNGGAAGQPLRVLKSGDLTLNAVLTAGVAYYLSNTPGGICPVADVGASEYVVLLGLAKSTTVLAVDIQYPGVSN
jgi:hypothetical protein